MIDPIDDPASPYYCDPLIEFFKKDVDRTLLRENLKLTVEQRIRKAMLQALLEERRKRDSSS